MDQTTTLALDILVMEEMSFTAVSKQFSVKKKKKCCNKIAKNKQCKRCPLLNIV